MSLRCAASSTGKRKACGVWARIQAVARHGGRDQAVGHKFQRIGDRHGGDRPGSVLQGRQQGRDGPRRDQRPRRVVHQHDIRRRGLQRLQPGPHAVLASGTARHRRQVRQAAQRRLDRRRVADRLQQIDVGGQRLGGVADHRLSGERQKLLRRLGAESAARPGCDQDRCYAHAGTVAGRPIGVNSWPSRTSWTSELTRRRGICFTCEAARAISHCTSACVSLICPIDEQVS